MAKEACLVAWINPTTEQIVKVGVYSQQYPTPGGDKWQPACLDESFGVNYEEARRRMYEKLAKEQVRPPGPRWIGWVYKLLTEQDRAEVDRRSPACPHCGGKLPEETPQAAPDAREEGANSRWRCSGCGLKLMFGSTECPKCGTFEGNLGLVSVGHTHTPKGQVGQ